MQVGKISPRQLTGLLMVMVLSSGLLVLPGSVLDKSGRGAVISFLLAGLFGVLVTWVLGTLAEHYPEMPFTEVLNSLVGKHLALVLILLYAVFWQFTGLQVIRQGADFLHIAFLPETPLFVIIITLNALAAYAAYLGLESMARFNTFVIPTIFIGIISVGVLNYNHFELNNLLPIKGIDPLQTLKGSIGPLAFIAEISVFLLFAEETQGKKRRTAIIKASLISAFLFALVMLFVILTGGGKLPALYYFPTLELARIIFIGNNIRGFDALIMTIWVTAVSLKIAIWFYAIAKLLGDAFQLNSRRSLIVPIMLWGSILGLISYDNTLEMRHYLAWIWPPYALVTFEFGIPLILLLISFWKKRKLQQ